MADKIRKRDTLIQIAASALVLTGFVVYAFLVFMMYYNLG